MIFRRLIAKPPERNRPDLPEILRPVERSYGFTVRKYGPVNKGVGWSNAEWQFHRFNIFAGMFAYEKTDALVINDLGCGYGAMFEAYANLPQLRNGRYIGYDINPDMLKHAKARIRDPRAKFLLTHRATEEADYSFVSGSYNIKMHADDADWLAFVTNSLFDLWSMTRTGLAFNMMSVHAPEKLETLYYADPELLLAFCKRRMSESARLHEGYSEKEWTIFVRR